MDKTSWTYESHRPVVGGRQWAIVSGHPLASQAGAEVLSQGGHAADAALAGAAVLAVVRPHMCGLGGDLFALVFDPAQGLTGLNASGRTPRAASLSWFRERGLAKMPAKGLLAATVPGVVSGWAALHDRFGTWAWERLLGSARDYARSGFPVYAELSRALEVEAGLLRQSPAATAVFFSRGRAPWPGELLRQSDLADSLDLLARQGPAAFYQGRLAEAVVTYSQAQGGLFDLADLAGHRADWTAPIMTTHAGHALATHPPNSQGLAWLLQANILENFDLAGLDPTSAEYVHLLVEAKKLALADRDAFITDPDLHPAPVAELLDKEYARRRAGLINPRAAAPEVSPGLARGGEDTVYLAVVDREGRAVALIQSLYESFGSGVMIPGTGIILHNRGRDLRLDETHPNRVEPAKRPYHTLTPAMILKDGRPAVVLGSPGADGQTQTLTQLTAHLLHYGADPQQAVEAPRFRSNPDLSLDIENRFPAATLDKLATWGHRLTVRPAFDPVCGSAKVIVLDPAEGVLLAGADPRRQAYALAG